jgi:hypothetical protein
VGDVIQEEAKMLLPIHCRDKVARRLVWDNPFFVDAMFLRRRPQALKSHATHARCRETHHFPIVDGSSQDDPSGWSTRLLA